MLKIVEQRAIALPRDVVWNALIDPEVVKECIRGCRAVDIISGTAFSLLIDGHVGPIAARFVGNIELMDLDPPRSYTMIGAGKANMIGYTWGVARVRLDYGLGGNKSHTRLNCVIEIAQDSKLLKLGSGIMRVTANRLSESYFSRFARLVENREPLAS
jgi:carbon monoxide dehydrogenase subunit G